MSKEHQQNFHELFFLPRGRQGRKKSYGNFLDQAGHAKRRMRNMACFSWCVTSARHKVTRNRLISLFLVVCDKPTLNIGCSLHDSKTSGSSEQKLCKRVARTGMLLCMSWLSGVADFRACTTSPSRHLRAEQQVFSRSPTRSRFKHCSHPPCVRDALLCRTRGDGDRRSIPVCTACRLELLCACSF